MTAEATEEGRNDADKLIGYHAISAITSFRREYPRLDTPELRDLTETVFEWAQADSGWGVSEQRTHVAGVDYVNSAGVVFVSPNQVTENLALRQFSPILHEPSIEEALASGNPSQDVLEYLFDSPTYDAGDNIAGYRGSKPWVHVASVRREEKVSPSGRVVPVNKDIAAVKIGYHRGTKQVVARVNPGILPEGRSVNVSHEVPLLDFAHMRQRVNALAKK
jgi:hypothetical protein